MANITIQELSLTISQLVDLDPSQQHLIETALDRAIAAQDLKDIVGGIQLPSLITNRFPRPVAVGISLPRSYNKEFLM